VPLLPVVLVAVLLVGLLGAVDGLRDRPPGRWLLRGVLALQGLLLVQAGVAVAGLVGGDDPPSAVVFAGYLLLSVLLLPGAFALVVEERSRYGSLLLGGACLVVAVVELRLQATA
jgi:cell shape-determining protein MreD